MANGAIRYNYEKEVWEFSNDRQRYDEFSTKQHTHASGEIVDATTNNIARTIVRRGDLGEAAFGRVTVGGTTRIEGLFLSVGSSNAIQDTELQTIAGATITGTVSNFKIVVQDGGGRTNLLWNATRSFGGRYLASGEAATRVMIDANDVGSRFGVYGSSRGLANQDIRWRQLMLIDADGSIYLGTDTEDRPNITITPSGDMRLARGKMYAQAYETHSARALKRDIELFEESALEILNAVTVHTFKYKEDTDNLERVGIIADTVSDTRIAGANHDRFDVASTVGMLIKAVQELTQRVEILERERK